MYLVRNNIYFIIENINKFRSPLRSLYCRKQDEICNWQYLVEWQNDRKLSPSVGLKWHMTLMWENLAGYQSWFQFIKLSVIPLIHYILLTTFFLLTNTFLSNYFTFFSWLSLKSKRFSSLWYIVDMFTENWNSENHSLSRFTLTGSRNKNLLDNSYDLKQ